MLRVRELIELLQSLPAESQDYYVGSSYDADCAWTVIHGLKNPKYVIPSDSGFYSHPEETYIILQGD